MEFIKELHEARLTRQGGALKTLSYTDCCERAYLTMLILEVLRNFPETYPIAKGYAKKTSGHDNYKHFRMNGTDLYNFVYFIIGDDDALDKLKDPGAAKRMRKTVTLPVMAFNRYLMGLASGRASNMNDQAVFVSIENSLNIINTDYRDVRRNIFNLQRLATADKKKIVTRLLFAVRAKLRSSDIIEYVEKLAAVRDLETAKIKDPEPTVSIPDISVQGRDLALYRYLVGTDNIMLTKKFIELAKQGKPVAPQFVQAYLPAIKMIDNIVKGGPAFVSMLRTLEKRAKTQHKK